MAQVEPLTKTVTSDPTTIFHKPVSLFLPPNVGRKVRAGLARTVRSLHGP